MVILHVYLHLLVAYKHLQKLNLYTCLLTYLLTDIICVSGSTGLVLAGKYTEPALAHRSVYDLCAAITYQV